MPIDHNETNYKTNELRKDYGRVAVIALSGARALKHLDKVTADEIVALSQCENTLDSLLKQIPEDLSADYTPKLEVAPIYNAAHDKFTEPASPKNVKANAQKTKEVLGQAQKTQQPTTEQLEQAIEFLYALANVYVPWADTPHQI